LPEKEKRNSVREYLFTIWYGIVSRVDKKAEVQFMNYGYSSPDLTVSLKGNHEHNRYPIQLYHQIAAKATLQGKDIVEVGSGRGGGLAYLMDNFSPRSAVGIDLNPVAINFCNEHYKTPGLSFTQANAEKLPFEDNSQDIILNVESSHRYANMSNFLSEVKRVLRPGGLFLITDFRQSERMPHLIRTFEESGLAQLLEEFITQKVVKALESDDSRRRYLVKKLMPWYLHRTGYNFAAVKGSKTFNCFADERMLYFNYVYQKDQ
jgi:ubiquinone/menaquinone biosynthesis C-methylase UbiE